MQVAVYGDNVIMDQAAASWLHALGAPVSAMRVQGRAVYSVPHTFDAVRIFRNAGVELPTKMKTQGYDFPGKFAPYKHQLDTADFLAGYERAFCLSSPGCVDSDTEYLSPTGWVRMDSYAGGQVAQYEPETGKATFVDPIQYVKKPCDQMVRITGRGVDQLLSPDHRVLAYFSHGKRTRVVTAAQVLAD